MMTLYPCGSCLLLPVLEIDDEYVCVWINRKKDNTTL